MVFTIWEYANFLLFIFPIYLMGIVKEIALSFQTVKEDVFICHVFLRTIDCEHLRF